jgi:hypothetical protein
MAFSGWMNGFVLLGQEAATNPIQATGGLSWSEAARSRFVLPEAAQLQQAEADLLSARDQLLDRLDALPDGQAIAKELELTAFEQVCKSPSLEKLDQLILQARLMRDERIQEPVDQVRQALRNFRRLQTLTLDPTSQERFSRSIEVLDAALQKPSTEALENYDQIAEAYHDLSQTRLVDDLLMPVYDKFSHPNQRLDVAHPWISRLLDREIKFPVKINRNEQGMKISGQGQVVAVPSAVFVPDPNQASVKVHFVGKVNSDVVGQKKPLVLHSHSLINLSGDVMIHLDGVELEVEEPTIATTSCTTLTGLCLQLKCRILNPLLTPLVSKIAQKKLRENDPKSAAKTRDDLTEKVEEYREDLIIQVNDAIEGFVWQTFDAKDIQTNLRSQTTNQVLSWSGEFVGPDDLGATSPPDVSPTLTDLSIQFHESTFNNTNFNNAGRRMNEATFTEIVYDKLQFASDIENIDPLQSRIPASFTFADFQPLHVRFDEGAIEATLNIKAFSFDLKKFDDVSRKVTVTYKPILTESGFTLERQGPIHVDGELNEDSKVLLQAMERFFKPQFVSAAMEGALSKASLKVGGISIDHGWFNAFFVPKS